ncbi:MAG TPA: glycosyltransferase family 2 protein [Acidisphaera sp.]|nr:glycosyltransferase family 2 protein [Acidisphaera sp.]
MADSTLEARPLTAAPQAGAPDVTVVVPCYNERDNVAPLVERLDAALVGFAWEVVFVDDNSPDGTADAARALAEHDARVRCIRRIGRRGLASAVIEGALSSSAQAIAVIDGDLQHDETKVPEMLRDVLSGGYDLAVGTRHAAGADDSGLSSGFRQRLSHAGIRVAQAFLPVRLTDPMSGFFAIRRDVFERTAPRLTGSGFKILLDLVLSAPAPLRVAEVPFRFRARASGDSKLDVLVLVQFAGLLLDKLTNGAFPLRFVAFALVGALGVLVNVAVLVAAQRFGVDFTRAQTIATICAMAFNFLLNNQVTYRDRRLRGAAVWRGLLLFMLVCGVGAIANIGIARTLYAEHATSIAAGAMGAVIGVVWNYAVSATLVWRVR